MNQKNSSCEFVICRLGIGDFQSKKQIINKRLQIANSLSPDKIFGVTKYDTISKKLQPYN